MPRIAQLRDNIDRTRYIVLQRENLLGRSEEASIRVDNAVVSRRHARIARMPHSDSYFIEDISARGTYVNFRRIRGRYPLKEGDRICVIRFHNVHPVELENMTSEQLKDSSDDTRTDNIKTVADFTFGYVELGTAQLPQAKNQAAEPPKGLLAKLKALLGKK